MAINDVTHVSTVQKGGYSSRRKKKKKKEEKKTVTPGASMIPAGTSQEEIASKTAPLIDLTPKKKDKGLLEKGGEFIASRLSQGLSKDQSNLGKVATLGANIAGDITTAAAVGTAAYFSATAAINLVSAGGKSALAGIGTGKATTMGLSKTGSMVKIATNTKTLTQTTSLLTKIVKAAGKPAVIVGGIIAAIGTYPFAGFIKEEALQTLSMGVRSAIASGDIAGAEAAIKAQEELLDPSVWQQILSIIPGVNLLTQLQNFYKAARTKLDIDSTNIANMKAQSESSTNADGTINKKNNNTNWDKIYANQEANREQQRTEDEAYYQKIEANRLKAKAEERAADEKYWTNIAKKKQEDEEAKRKADNEYWNAINAAKQNNIPQEEQAETDYQKAIDAWTKAKEDNRKADEAYWKKVMEDAAARKKENEKYWAAIRKAKEDATKSNLNFGLL